MKGLFLFGAGASYGSPNIFPASPPLGSCLYLTICNQYPHSWGSLGILDPKVDSIFKNNFEEGMDYFCHNYPDKVADYWQDMAMFFASYRLSGYKKDYYSHIINDLIEKRKIDNYAFSTLNYECLLELAFCDTERKVSYVSQDGMNPGKTLVWKLHGSCNFKVKGIAARKGCVTFRINDVAFHGTGIEYIENLDSVRKYCDESAIPLCMSLYAPGKPNQVGRPAIEEIQRQWTAFVAEADKIFIIGVAPNLPDQHIWQPLSRCGGHIYYIGGEKIFRKWADEYRKSSPYTFIGETFSESLIKIKELV